MAKIGDAEMTIRFEEDGIKLLKDIAEGMKVFSELNENIKKLLQEMDEGRPRIREITTEEFLKKTCLNYNQLYQENGRGEDGIIKWDSGYNFNLCCNCKFLRRVETVGLKVNQFPFCAQLNKIIAVKVQECKKFEDKESNKEIMKAARLAAELYICGKCHLIRCDDEELLSEYEETNLCQCDKR